MNQFIVAIVFWIIGIVVLYLVIQSAIDNSRTANEIKEIRKLLEKQLQNNRDTGDTTDLEILNTAYENCPACGAKVAPEDKDCHDCGLSLKE